MTSTSAIAPKRFALVVGIESYPGGEAARLPGCLLDAQIFRQTLVEGCGFGAGEVEMLLDRKATRAGILGGIERQLQRAARGDLFVFYYSGHGSVFPDRLSAEQDETQIITPVGSRGPLPPDRYDTSLVPVDSDGKSAERSWGNYILDDELYALFSRFAAAGCHVVFVSDSCFSGTLARDLGNDDSREKYLPPDTYFKSLGDAAGDTSRASQVAAIEKAPDFKGRYLVFGSSSDTQTSIATRNGSLFTLALREVIRENPRQSYQQVFDRVRSLVAEVSKQRQEPQLDARFYRGSTREPFLSLPPLTEAPPPPAARALRIGVVVIDAANRAIPETAIGLFPPGTATGQGQVRAETALFLGRTDAKGIFISEKMLPPGPYRMKVVHRDYQKFEDEIELRESRTQPGTALLVVRLKPE